MRSIFTIEIYKFSSHPHISGPSLVAAALLFFIAMFNYIDGPTVLSPFLAGRSNHVIRQGLWDTPEFHAVRLLFFYRKTTVRKKIAETKKPLVYKGFISLKIYVVLK